jgi:cell division protein FtsL
MTSGTFEFVIKKDVRNNPIVREVDRKRHREMWRAIAIGVVVVVALLFSAWQHFELIRHGYRIEAMQRERLVQDEINRHLRLEIETLRSPARIERLATGQLQMLRQVPGTPPS